MTSSLPYGLWRRETRRVDLDAWEQRQRDDEEAWDLRHDIEARALDALVGQAVVLRRSMETFTGTILRRGARFVVRGRIKGVLLVERPGLAESLPMIIKPEWVRREGEEHE